MRQRLAGTAAPHLLHSRSSLSTHAPTHPRTHAPARLQAVRFANLGPAEVEIAGVAREQHPSVDPGGGEDDRVRQPQLPLLAQQHRLLRDADVDLENMEPTEKTPDTYDS